MEKKTITLNFKVDEPTVNGHIYSKEVFQKALADKDEYPTTYGFPNWPHLEIPVLDTIGSAKLQINEDNTITGILTIFDLPAYKAIKDTLLENYDFTIRGIGNINKDKIITNFKLLSIAIIPKPEENTDGKTDETN